MNIPYPHIACNYKQTLDATLETFGNILIALKDIKTDHCSAFKAKSEYFIKQLETCLPFVTETNTPISVLEEAPYIILSFTNSLSDYLNKIEAHKIELHRKQLLLILTNMYQKSIRLEIDSKEESLLSKDIALPQKNWNFDNVRERLYHKLILLTERERVNEECLFKTKLISPVMQCIL